MDLSDRGIRHRDIIPPNELSKVTALIVGTGAIGRQVALQLAAIGVPKLVLVDFDTVEVENLAAQGFLESDLGKLKVSAVDMLARQINSELDVIYVAKEYGIGQLEAAKAESPRLAVFCCVDSIDVRKQIWQDFLKLVNKNNPFAIYIDGRMRAEVARVLAVSGIVGRDYYPDTLFSAADAEPGSCTAKTTIYCANIAAGMMVSQLTKWLRDRPLDRDIMYNIVTGEVVKDVESAAAGFTG